MGSCRQRVTQSAAAQLIPQLVRSAVSVLRDQLDGLVLQFKSADYAARVVVDTRGGSSDNIDTVQPSLPAPEPADNPAPEPVPA